MADDTVYEMQGRRLRVYERPVWMLCYFCRRPLECGQVNICRRCVRVILRAAPLPRPTPSEDTR